jgi:hypothetical protein
VKTLFFFLTGLMLATAAIIAIISIALLYRGDTAMATIGFIEFIAAMALGVLFFYRLSIIDQE